MMMMMTMKGARRPHYWEHKIGPVKEGGRDGRRRGAMIRQARECEEEWNETAVVRRGKREAGQRCDDSCHCPLHAGILVSVDVGVVLWGEGRKGGAT